MLGPWFYMKKVQSPEEKFEMMTQRPVKSLICSLAVPSIVSMLISSIYNMADTFFVSQINTSASGAVGVSFSLMAIIQSLGFMIGMGSGNYISRLLGQKNREQAEKVVATGFFTAIGVGLVLAVFGLIFIDPLVFALGSTETIAPYAKAYVSYILIGAPYMIAAIVLNNTLRLQGNAFYSMIGLATGGILNVGLDPLFIFTFGLGTGGAALATIISQFVSFCILFSFTGKHGSLKVHIKSFTPKWGLYKEILRGGLPSFYRQSLASVSMIFLNFSAGPYGDAAIAAMSIVTRVFQFSMSILMGFGQGFQPVCGFNYGAKRYDRVMEGFWFCSKLMFFSLMAISVLVFLFAQQIVTVFRRNDPDVIAIGTIALRYICVTLPFTSFMIVCDSMLQTIGKAKFASILAISRQGLYFIPLVLTLPYLFGLTGVQLSQPISNILSFATAVPMCILTMKEMKSQHEEQGKQLDIEKITEMAEKEILE